MIAELVDDITDVDEKKWRSTYQRILFPEPANKPGDGLSSVGARR
jgi:hypothetical protein